MTTHSKCNTKDTLCNENDETYVTVPKNLEMSAKHVYIIRKTNDNKYFPLKQTKTPLYMISDNSHAKRRHLLYENNFA